MRTSRRNCSACSASNRGYEPRGDDEPVAEGDNLGISFKGTIDGKTVLRRQPDHAHVVVGAGEFIPGFEEQLIGMKKGETASIDVTFPDDYNREELRGKTAKFEVTVLHADAPQAGVELNDDFAKRLGLDDLDALRTRDPRADAHGARTR